MNEFIVKLRILARAEVTLFKADAARRTNQALLAAISIGCVFVGLVFLNLGAFFTLTESEIDSRAAFILAAVNIGLAFVPFLLRRQSKPGAEEAMVREIREMAAEEISKAIASGLKPSGLRCAFAWSTTVWKFAPAAAISCSSGTPAR